MKTTLTALPAGAGVFRIPSFRVANITVPMVTALFVDNQWMPFIDGENLQKQYASGCVRLSLHRCIANYLQGQGRNPSIDVVIEGDK
jgi:hypothetical protein